MQNTRLMELASVLGAAAGSITANAAATMGFGSTRSTNGAAVSADTVFEAASLSNPLFAYLMLCSSRKTNSISRGRFRHTSRFPMPQTRERRRSPRATCSVTHQAGETGASARTISSRQTSIRRPLQLLRRGLLLRSARRRENHGNRNSQADSRESLRPAWNEPHLISLGT